MFCPKCGQSDQQANSYCRQCGLFLPDFDNLKKRRANPEDHLKASSALSLMTAVVSLSLAVTLYIMFLGKEGTPFIIYLTAGFLTAIFAWQVQTFWRTRLLKKHFRRRKGEVDEPAGEVGSVLSTESKPTLELLGEGDFNEAIPASVRQGKSVRRTNKIN
jgi:hypothetical protein